VSDGFVGGRCGGAAPAQGRAEGPTAQNTTMRGEGTPFLPSFRFANQLRLNCDLGGFGGLIVIEGEPVLGCLIIWGGGGCLNCDLGDLGINCDSRGEARLGVCSGRSTARGL